MVSLAGATPLGNMVIKLGLDDADFGKGVANSKKQVMYLAKEMQANMKIADMAGNKLGKLGTRYDSLTNIIKAQEKQVASLKKAYDESFVDGKATDSTKRLAGQLQDANGKLANYKLQLQNTAGQLARMQVETQGFTGFLNRQGDAFIKAGQKIEKFGSGVSKLGNKLSLGVTAPIALGFTKATKSASDFTTQIGEIGPLLTNGAEVTKEYADQLTKMGNSSKQWAKDYGISTSEINVGLAEVVRKGYDANQTLGVMPSILNATKASGDAFNDVMNVTTEVISQFNLKGKDYASTVKNAERVTDSLTFVANATSAGFSDLGLAMGYVGPVANSLSMTVEETAASIGLLSDAGIGGEKAGTAMRGALTRLLKPSKQNIEGFKQLGIKVSDFKKGTLTLPDILDKIKNNTKDWTDAQRTSAIALAFGTESQSAMNVLVGQGGDALRKLTADTEKANGATKNIAKTMNDLPANKMARFKESLNVLSITIGEKLLPVVTPLIEKATEMVNKFSELDEATQQNIIKWGLMAAAAGPALKVVGSGVSILGKTTTGVGTLSKGLVELAAKAAEKKAIEGMATATTTLGTSALTASGAGGVGAMTSALGALGPVALGVAGVIGVGGLLYGAWKMFGEEAWNSSQRVQRWGVDLGETTDKALTDVQNYTSQATGQFGLLSQGFANNSDEMANNFSKIGDVIESNLIKKIKGLQKLIDELPENVDSSLKEMLTDEQEKAQQSLDTVQANSARIQEIREQASNHNRELSASESKMIADLAKDSTQAYVETLDVSAQEKKKILAAMTGDVANATEQEAKLWVQSLGKQRQVAAQNMEASRKEKEQYLKDLGYNLNGEFAQKFLESWDEINQTTVDGFDQQMATILEKYPELQNEVFLANGQLIDSSSEAGKQMILTNEQIIENAGRLSSQLAQNATKNAEVLAWTVDESNDHIKKGAQLWNDTVFDEKTGEVKTNANEAVTEATKDVTNWNNMKLLVHEADLDSNAKKIIGEAAIANGWWDGMAWEDKSAVLQDDFSITMVKALEDSGQWDSMTFEEKKAVLYSNTPEIMTQTMFDLGLWDKYKPELKSLKADNFQFLDKLSQSKESLDAYNKMPPELKKFLGDAPITMTSEQAMKAIKDFNNLPPKLKKLLAENTDVKNKVDGAKRQIDSWGAKGIPKKTIVIGADTSGATQANNAIAGVRGKTVYIDIIKRASSIGSAVGHAKGTPFHKGGDMLVNDQSGPLYKEIVQFPGQAPFIPQGRNVYIPNAPTGTKVVKASLTKSILAKLGVPRYADGVGVPRDSQMIRNLESLETRQTPITDITINQRDYSAEFNTLISIMSQFSNDLKNMKVLVDGSSFNRANAGYQSSESANRMNLTERGLALDVKL